MKELEIKIRAKYEDIGELLKFATDIVSVLKENFKVEIESVHIRETP